MEAHGAELSDKEPVVELLGVLVLHPVRFGGETVVIPAFLSGEVIAFSHPLRLQPEHVARDIYLAEHRRVVEYVELLLTHIRAEAKAVGPLRKHIGAAGDCGVRVQYGWHIGACHQEEIGLVVGVDNIEQVLVHGAYVEEALSGGIVVYSPASRAHHEGHRDLSVLVGDPHSEELATVLDMVAAGAASAIETLSVLHFDGDGADFHRSRNLPLVHLGEFLVIPDYAAAVADDVEVFPFLVDGLS